MNTDINKIKIEVLEAFFKWQDRDIKAQSTGKHLYCQAKMDAYKHIIQIINKIEEESRVGKQDKANPRSNTAEKGQVGSDNGN